MKTIVNSETGEIIEIEETNEIVEKKLNEIVSLDDVLDAIEMLETYEQKLNMYKAQLKEPLIKLFKENGIKTFKNDYLTISYVESTLQKRVDNERLKQDGLYEKYLKLVPVSEQIRITKKGKND
ncbi:MAG: hypothetical protein KBT03_02880 [Bacteroidales bacterium]|nr:hypothetical protein [Candidatus Scybalousia scybalohippi]